MSGKNDFSISLPKIIGSKVDKINEFNNKKKYEIQQAQIRPETFYNNLLGAQIGGTSNLGATRAD